MSRRPVRAAAVAACAAGLLALPTASALAEGLPAASAAQSAGPRTLLRSVALADGVSRADVYRAGEAYEAEILDADGVTAAVLTSRNGVTDIGGTGALHAALRPDGRLDSWVGGGAATARQATAASPRPAGGAGDADGSGHKTGIRDGRVVAAGTTGTLRLHTLADEPGDGLLLLAAGGGIAAVGAAGLAFAMHRRGRTDH
ncbi:hypothetical protein [Streptomyces sp. 2P-4]|uniref:hypothetical protein n=1 Tax=Streptomyces sp. 2P-4 TaxID=2931974 RepID=UPI0025420325|nr:hypothetical protein [Streptomyces sp. 2P-4]